MSAAHDVREAASGDAIEVDGCTVTFSDHPKPGECDWAAHGVELVLECTGEFRTQALLEPYFGRGVQRVVVSAPVKEARALEAHRRPSGWCPRAGSF